MFNGLLELKSQREKSWFGSSTILQKSETETNSMKVYNCKHILYTVYSVFIHEFECG